jgi:hypothetical protein
MVTSTTLQLPPSAAPTPSHSPTVPTSTATPTKRSSARHEGPAGPCPPRPTTIPQPNPAQPACGPTFHPRQLPRLVSFPSTCLTNPVRPASCTAAQYSNAADQHRPRTSTTDRRPAEIATIDYPARSSGRRSRGFKSRHPDQEKSSLGDLAEDPWGPNRGPLVSRRVGFVLFEDGVHGLGASSDHWLELVPVNLLSYRRVAARSRFWETITSSQTSVWTLGQVEDASASLPACGDPPMQQCLTAHDVTATPIPRPIGSHSDADGSDG